MTIERANTHRADSRRKPESFSAGVQRTTTVSLIYPDDVATPAMPPDVLAALPKLPADLEYRIVENDLILLDVDSHLIMISSPMHSHQAAREGAGPSGVPSVANTNRWTLADRERL